MKTRPERAESRRCSCSEAPPFANNRPFLMSRVCGSTYTNTSVPIIASVPVARLQTMMGNSVCNPMNDTTQRKHPDTLMPVPFALRSVLTDDPESTRNSTEWSPIQPFKNQCPAPDICIMGSSHGIGSSIVVGVIGRRPTGEGSVFPDSSRSGTGNWSTGPPVGALVGMSASWDAS